MMSNPKGGNRKGSQGRRIWLSAEAAALMDSVKKDLGYGSTGTDSLVIVQALSTLKLALRGGSLSSLNASSAGLEQNTGDVLECEIESVDSAEDAEQTLDIGIEEFLE